MKAFHIVHWDSLYETSETRKIRTLTFYAKPNKLVGEGIGLTLAEPDNVALLGTWALIEALASTSARDHRGWLVRNGTALTAPRMAALTRVDVGHFERALVWFSRPEIGWLELKECAGLLEQSPANLPPVSEAGKSPADSPANLPQEREREREREKDKRESEAHTLSAARSAIPSKEEVEAWALAADVDPAFALEKLAEARERGDFDKPAVRKHWQDRFARFWKTDAAAWRKKKQKNPAPPGADGGSRPDGWKPEDAPNWWTDSIADLRSAQRGAALVSDQKTAGRLREIIQHRENA